MANNTDIPATLATLKLTAAAQVAQYPQYAGHFAGYRLAIMKRDVKTKMGSRSSKASTSSWRPSAPGIACPA